MKQVSSVCRKTCNLCTEPLVAQYVPRDLNLLASDPYRTPTFGRPIQTGLPVSGTTYNRPVQTQQQKPVQWNMGFNNVMQQLGFRGNQQMFPAKPVAPVAPVAPVKPVYEAPPVYQRPVPVQSVDPEVIPYEVAVMHGMRNPYEQGKQPITHGSDAWAIKQPSDWQQYTQWKQQQPLAPVAPVAPRPVYVYKPYVQPADVKPIYQVTGHYPVDVPAVVDPQIYVQPAGVQTTAAPTQEPENEIEGSGSIEQEEEAVVVGVVTTQAPTEAPEGSGAVEDEAVETVPVTFDTAPLPITADEIPEAVIVGAMDPETASDLMDAMCVDELTNCSDFLEYNFCNITKQDVSYAMYLPFQQGCRKTCGHCDKNAACPELVDFCNEEDVRSVCAATCREALE